MDKRAENPWLYTRVGTHHHHHTTDPPLRSSICTNSFTMSSGSQPTSDATHSVDKAVFRRGYSPTDHSFTFQQLRTRAAEWHQRLRVAAIVPHSEAQQRMEGLAGTRPRGAIHTLTHKALRLPTSNSTHRHQKQTLPPRTGNQAGRPALRAIVQLTLAVRHLSNLGFTDDILLVTGSLKHTTTSRPHHSPDGTRTATIPRENQNTFPTRHQHTSGWDRAHNCGCTFFARGPLAMWISSLAVAEEEWGS